MSAGAAEPVVYTLKWPVELKGADGSVLERITQLQLRRLRGGAARKVLNAQQRGAGDFAQELLCASAGIPPSTFEQLDAEDILDATVVAAPFLGSALPT